MAAESGAERILCISLNQNHTCFTIGTTQGFRVYEINPLKIRYRREWGSGVGIAELYMRSNIVALVGGGPVPRHPPNKVVVWDDYQAKSIAELEFATDIRGLKLRQERLLVALDNSIFVYNFKDLSYLLQFTTFVNPSGLVMMNLGQPILELFPAEAQGSLILRTETIDEKGQATTAEKTIIAHNGALACIATTFDGRLVATASEKGTLIRVWNTEDGKMIKELRRGAESARIYSMCFSEDGSMLAVTSSHGTCHIFGVAEGMDNKRASLGVFKGVLPSYFKSEWSSMRVEIPKEVQSVVSFAKDKSLFLIAVDGTFQRIVIDGSQSPPIATVDVDKDCINILK